MIKIRVHIHSSEVFMDDRLYMEIQLPSVPNVGDYLYLDISPLYSIAHKSLDIAKDYYEWFYGETIVRFEDDNYRLSEIDLPNLCFDDAGEIKNVCYYADRDYVCIEIG